MIRIERTNSENESFRYLVDLLDIELAEKDGKDYTFYTQYNKIDLLEHCVLVYMNNSEVGCGAFREMENSIIEIKRMYTIPDHRGKGIASLVLSELEKWAKELGISQCILETGKRQHEAISLYKKRGYSRITNYGPYIGIENSICLKKLL